MIPNKEAPPEPPASYKGFFRPARGRRWTGLVEDAVTYDDAWGRLLELAPSDEKHGELYVGRTDPSE
jgi:hypothetical protein